MEETMMVGKHLEEEEEAHKLVGFYYKGLVLVMELEWWVVSNIGLDQFGELDHNEVVVHKLVEVEVEVAENSQGSLVVVA